MDEACIRKAWTRLEWLFGPDYPGRHEKLKKAAQTYAEAVLASKDRDRINRIGKKHLQFVAEEMLDGKQFDLFLTHVIRVERYMDW